MRQGAEDHTSNTDVVTTMHQDIVYHTGSPTRLEVSMPRTLTLALTLVLGGCLPGPAGILGPTGPSLNGEGAHAGHSGPPTLMNPAPPSPHSRTELPDGQGEVYVLAQTIYHRAPGEAPRPLYQMAERTSFIRVAPDLSYVLLHERLPEVLQAQAPRPIPTLGTGGEAFFGLHDNQTIVISRHRAKYEGVARLALYPADGEPLRRSDDPALPAPCATEAPR